MELNIQFSLVYDLLSSKYRKIVGGIFNVSRICIMHRKGMHNTWKRYALYIEKERIIPWKDYVKRSWLMRIILCISDAEVKHPQTATATIITAL